MCQVGTVDTMGNSTDKILSVYQVFFFFTVLNFLEYGRPQDNKQGYSKIETDDLIVKILESRRQDLVNIGQEKN